MRMLRPVVRLVAASLVVSGCATASVAHRQAEAGDDGVQVTGTLGGSRVAISEGVPDVVFGDCDPGIDIDEDVCWSARTIDGMTVAMVVENPDVLAADTVIDIVDDACDLDCDQVTEGAVVDIRWNGQQVRAVSGRLEVSAASERVAAGMDVNLVGGDGLTGMFNIRELRPEER